MDGKTIGVDFESFEREAMPSLNDRIDTAYSGVGKYLDLSFDQFQQSILSSQSPEDEAIRWAGIAAVWDDFQRKYLLRNRLDFADWRKILAALIAISTGEQELSKLPVSFDVATALLSSYVDLADELPYSNP